MREHRHLVMISEDFWLFKGVGEKFVISSDWQPVFYQLLLIHNYVSCLCTYLYYVKVTVNETFFKWILQRDKLLQCWIFRKISDVPQRFILGPVFFLIHINNLSNNIVALAIKQLCRYSYFFIHQWALNRGQSNSIENVFFD